MQDLGDKMQRSNAIMLFGYPLFGGWLPYVGFRTVSFTKEELSDMLHTKVDNDASYNPLVLEWLGKGISFGRLKVS